MTFRMRIFLTILLCIFLSFTSYTEALGRTKKSPTKAEKILIKKAKREECRLARQKRKQRKKAKKQALKISKRIKRAKPKKLSPAREKEEKRQGRQTLKRIKQERILVKRAKRKAKIEVSTVPLDDYTKRILDKKVLDFLSKREGDLGLLREKRIGVRLNVHTVYDDNVFLVRDNTKRDVITHISPGVSVYGGDRNSLFVGSYDADILTYVDHPTQNRANHSFSGKMHLFRQSPAKVTLIDTLQYTTNPPASETTEFVRRLNNNFAGALRYEMSPKTAISLNYNQVLQNYISSAYKKYSHLQNELSPALYWHLSPKVSLTTGYTFGAFSYYQGRDYDSWYHLIRGGIEGKLTEKSSIYLRSGLEYRDYRHGDSQDTADIIFEGTYKYDLSPKTTLEFIASRHINESVYRDVSYYKTINTYASCTHRLRNNLKLTFSTLYIRSDYPHETPDMVNMGYKKRADNLFGASAKINYDFRSWLSAYAEYGFRYRESNMRNYEYRNNRISGGVRLNF